MRAIFISYRRDDSEGHAGRLFEDLRDRFGSASVFMDVAGIEPGRDFRKVIEQQVASCGVLLAVIGKSWLTSSASDAQGRRRLDDPHDFVRLETATALTRDIPVIPVLVHGAQMPRPEELPDALKDLAFRNGVELSHARWSSDVQLLINALMPYVDAASPRAVAAAAPPGGGKPRRSALVALGVALPLAAAGVGYWAWHNADTADPPAPAPMITSVQPPPVQAAPVQVARIDSERAQLDAAAASQAPAPVQADKAASSASAARPDPQRLARPRPDDKTSTARAPAQVRAATPAPVPATVNAAAAPPAAPSVEASRAIVPEPALTEKPRVATVQPDSPVIARLEPNRGNPVLVGDPAPTASATRTIAIQPDTRYVNVTGGEVVRFTAGDRSFAWNFNGRLSSFDLATVAPQGMLDHKVTAYVAPNPLYRRSGR